MSCKCFLGIIQDKKWKMAKNCRFYYRDTLGEGRFFMEILRNKENVDKLRLLAPKIKMLKEEKVSNEMRMKDDSLSFYSGVEVLSELFDTGKLKTVDEHDYLYNHSDCDYAYIVDFDNDKFYLYMDGCLNLVKAYDLYKIPTWQTVRKHMRQFVNSDEYVNPFSPDALESAEMFMEYQNELDRKAKENNEKKGIYFPK